MAVSLSSLISMIVGASFGIIIVFFIYMLVVFRAVNNNLDINLNEDINIKLNEEINDYKKSHHNSIALCIQGMLDKIEIMTNYITKSLYPDSSNPLLEITVKQTLDLAQNISYQVDELLNKRALKILKRLKISQVIQLSLLKRKIDDNIILKLNSKYKITQKFGFIKGIINFVNPVYWIKKILMSTVIIFILRKICIRIINIASQETFKAYSNI